MAHYPPFARPKRQSAAIAIHSRQSRREHKQHGENHQPGVAARILASGTGLCVPLSELTAEKLDGMVTEVLANPACRQCAQALQTEIQSLDGLTMASRIIETAFESDGKT